MALKAGIIDREQEKFDESGTKEIVRVGVFDASGNQITSFGGSGGTSHADDAAFTIGSASSITPSGYLADDTTPDSVDEGDVGVARMTLTRKPYAVITDATAEQNACVTSGGALCVTGGGGGTQFADGAARGTATGTLAMVDDGTLIQSLSGDSTGKANVNVCNVPNIGTVTAVTTVTNPVAVCQATASNLCATVDTELPAAVVLADNTSNPTVPAVGSFSLIFDGTNWDRAREPPGDAVGTPQWFAMTPMVWNGATYDRAKGDSTDGLLVNLGSNNDVTLASIANPVCVCNTTTTNMCVAADTELTVKDFDTGVGTDNVAIVGLVVPASGGSACITGDTANGLDVDVTRVGGNVCVTQVTAANLCANVNAAQSGTWNITNISGTVSLPTGASTLAEQQSQTTALQIIDDWDNTASDGASVSGDVVHDGIDAGEPVKIGGKASTIVPTAVANADRVNAYLDANGRQAVTGQVLEGAAIAGVSLNPLVVGGIDSTGTSGFIGYTPLFVENLNPVNTLIYGVSSSAAADTTNAALFVGGDEAHDAADAGNPIKIGGKAVTALPTSVAANDRVNAFFDTQGFMGVDLAWATRSDTFTATGNGTTITATTTRPVKYFTVQVKGTGAVATAWDVRLEGSLNNADFTQIIAHTNVDGDAVVKWQGTANPILYFRSRVAGLTLGSATNIVVTILGVQ